MQSLNHGLLRTVVRAWREEADGRKAKTLRSVALRPGVERGAHPARMDTDTLSTMCSSQRVSGRGAGEELQQDLRKELLRRERKCESGSGVLPVARSACTFPSLQVCHGGGARGAVPGLELPQQRASPSWWR